MNHPNICTIYDIGEQDGQPFIAMEFLDGTTLKHRISGKPLPLEEMLELGIEIADALDAAHPQGIIHRDIKPANIFVTERGHGKILDFGLAKLTPAGAAVFRRCPQPVSRNAHSTGHGDWHHDVHVPGAGAGRRAGRTHGFVFLWRGALRDGDGTQPFRGETSGVIAEAILNRMPVTPVRLNPDLPPKLEEIINKALEKDRKLRYQNAADIRTDLQRLKRDTDSGRAAAVQVQVGSTPATEIYSMGGDRGRYSVVVGSGRGRLVVFLPQGAPLTDKDTIVLADFTNATGDTVFDGTLRQGLSVQLEQSPFLSIVSDQQIQQTLQMMGQQPDAKLTPEIARELCQRTASAAVLDGSIAQIGTQYLLTLKAVNCASGESLASTEAQASDKNHVLDALGKTASEIRNKLGESLSTVQKFDTPLEQATTPSLEALKAYSSGIKFWSTTGTPQLFRFSNMPSNSTRILHSLTHGGPHVCRYWRIQHWLPTTPERRTNFATVPVSGRSISSPLPSIWWSQGTWRRPNKPASFGYRLIPARRCRMISWAG